MSTEVTVDKEFAALCPPLTYEERALLESQIEKEGCRVPLDVWQENGKALLLDGHNRLEICKRYKKKFTTAQIKLADRNEARNWIINRQLGRRNVTEDQKSYLRGKRYIAEKFPVGGDRPTQRAGAQNGPLQQGRTDERLAGEYGVGKNTIKRDARFAEAIDTLANNTGDETRKAILGGELNVTKQDVVKLAELPAAKQRKAVEGGKEAIREAVSGNGTATATENSNGRLPVGVPRANEAINCLRKIPHNDPHRQRGFQIVMDWIKLHK